MKKQTITGARAFDEYYDGQEKERWPKLKEALLADNKHFGFNAHLLQTYYLDEASILAARWVEAQSDFEILDLCAAPGGKSLVIISELIKNGARNWHLDLNERSSPRRERLKKVIDSHIEPEIVADKIKIWGHDAGLWGQHQANRYDRILLDTPCSSERHVLLDQTELDKWSTNRIKTLSQQSYAFLLSAIQSLKPGGMVVYSTCAITNEENDRVIERVFDRIGKKSKDLGYTIELCLPTEGEFLPEWSEPTSFGRRVLPDIANGRGPMYMSRVKKALT